MDLMDFLAGYIRAESFTPLGRIESTKYNSSDSLPQWLPW